MAIYWYSKAAERHSPEALAALGYMYYNGEEVTQDYRIAYAYCMEAAGGHDADAMLNLGMMYEDSVYVSKNPKQAALWYLLFSMCGYNDRYNPSASEKLIGIFETDKDAIPEINIKGAPFGSSLISEKLIIEVQKYFFANDFQGLLNMHGLECKVADMYQFQVVGNDDFFWYADAASLKAESLKT